METINRKIYSNFLTPEDQIKEKLLSLALFPVEKNTDKQYLFIRSQAQKLYESFTNKENELGTYDRQIIHLLDIALVEDFLGQMKNSQVVENMVHHLLLLGAAVDTYSGLLVYPQQEFHDILSGKKQQYSSGRFIHTLRQSITSDTRHDDALAILNFISQGEKLMDIQETEDLIVLVLMLDILWKEFSNLPDDGQGFLLQSYFYYSITLSVPVRKELETMVYSTTTPVDFVLSHYKLAEYLGENNELIPLGEGKQKELRELYKEMNQQNVDSVSAFSTRVYEKESDKDIFSSWLTETLDIYKKVKEINLIERNLGGETNDADAYYDQLATLIQYFFEKENWKKISEYFRAEKMVTLPVFLRELERIIDLEKDNAIGKLVEFADFLHENGFLLNQELVEYHEQDGKFHWNENIFA
ncbi:MAG TPA: hypothetical protein VEA18_04130 [Candidatus Kapabacteria bacterium]|nr:hypothetical protein [Candidatus Kapabacteria bacterium]